MHRPSAQLAHCAFAVRAEAVEQSDKLAAALGRTKRYKELSRSQGEKFLQFERDLKAHQERLTALAQEAESRVAIEQARTTAVEATLTLVSGRHEAAATRVESPELQLRHAEERTESALDEIRRAMARATAAETAATEATRDKAVVEARAREADSRAEEAVRRAQEVEAWAQEAKARIEAVEECARYAQTEAEKARARAASAVEEYKASEDFEQEVIEGSLDAFAEGFKLCKEKVSAAFNISRSDLEKIRAEDPEGEAAAEEEEDTEGAVTKKS